MPFLTSSNSVEPLKQRTCVYDVNCSTLTERDLLNDSFRCHLFVFAVRLCSVAFTYNIISTHTSNNHHLPQFDYIPITQPSSTNYSNWFMCGCMCRWCDLSLTPDHLRNEWHMQYKVLHKCTGYCTLQVSATIHPKNGIKSLPLAKLLLQ